MSQRALLVLDVVAKLALFALWLHAVLNPDLPLKFAFDPNGSLWFTTGGAFGSAPLDVITPEAVAATE